MKQLFSHIILLTIVLTLSVSLCAAGSGCKANCRNGSCEVMNCDKNAVCKCNFLGNPVCKCSEKGAIEEIGDVAGDILNPSK
ncbi:MAG: hypothetical protein AB1756_03350 [Acidobacteriota bacterium]